ncbi:DUF998 domain-containing protein [Roseitranquillus sediminis]|uniref:DUF998 domain-containing protein n=1 Tax=Roseitranquillus sediminis TaxID=2809051 RepID=UPI001D0CC86C|nr:DUF998 domain-containing protein [Roseitranquillus sediminis]MBM9594559.1 DUF998 domain-containing protein [Roseitranquillus sediminis]
MTSIASEKSHLLVASGIIALLGAAALLIGVVVGSIFVPDHDWVAETISDLGAGPLEIIVDIALYGYAAGLISLSIGAAHAHLGDRWWSVGIFSLAIIAALVVMVGARNEYGDSDRDGIVIHIYLVYLLGVLFALAPLSMAKGAGSVHLGYRRIFRLCGVAWAVAAPVFFFVPTSVDGVYERLLGMIALIWTCSLAWLILQRGRDAAVRGV